MVVLPVPGGPTRRAALDPPFHFFNHATNLALASSLPTMASRLRGLYFSESVSDAAAYEDNEAHEHSEKSAVLHSVGILGAVVP